MGGGGGGGGEEEKGRDRQTDRQATDEAGATEQLRDCAVCGAVRHTVTETETKDIYFYTYKIAILRSSKTAHFTECE